MMADSTRANKRVLIAEDDIQVSSLMVQILKRSGIEAESVDNGNSVLQLIITGKFDLLLLDLMLPGMSGLEVLRKLREISDIPVIILSALSGEKDRIAGLELGSNDYVVKPYYPREVLVRIQNMLGNRQARQKTGNSLIRIGILTADTNQKKISMGEVDLDLTPLEFDVVMILIRNSGTVVDRKTISRMIYKNELNASTRRIDMKINHIRKKLGDQSEMIRTVWGVGYEFIPKAQS
jgi:DNA-binding response OmpR family regulator